MKKIYLFILACTLFACEKDEEKKETETLPSENISVLINDLVDAKAIIVGDSLKFSLAKQLSEKDVSFLWILNGATPSTSTQPFPKVKYKTEGTYDVKLIISRGTKVDTLLMPKLVKVESTITKGLIAYYPFNGSAKDMTGNGHDGISRDATLTKDRFGNPNAAYYFNGITSAIMVKDKQDLRLSQTNFTINLWVNLDNYDTDNGSALMIKRFSGVANGWGTSLLGGAKTASTIPGSEGHLYYKVSGGDDPFAIGTKKFDLNTWNMVTIVYNFKNKTISLYANGLLDTVTDRVPTPNGNCDADLFIGSDNFNTSSSGYHLKGKIDDIGFYNRMLSDQEIRRIYFNSEVVAPPVFDK